MDEKTAYSKDAAFETALKSAQQTHMRKKLIVWVLNDFINVNKKCNIYDYLYYFFN